MNIEKLLRTLRQAKKLRKATPFHQRAIHGIDVSKNDYQISLVFVKQLFKSLKTSGLEININHWGEIILTESVYKVKVAVSINYSLGDNTAKTASQMLEKQKYFCFPENISLQPRLICRFKILRNGTKWHTFNLQGDDLEREAIASKIVEQIQIRASSLTPNVKRNFQEQLEIVSIQDVLALIRYGAATFGESSCLFHLARDEHMFYPHKLVIENNTIQLISFNAATYPCYLKTREIKLFQLLISDILDYKIEIER